MFFKKMFVIYSLWQICVSLRPMRDGAAEVCRRVSPLVFAELIYKKCSFHLTYLFHIYFHLTHSNVFHSLFHFQFSFSVLLPRVATAMISQSLSESCETKSLVQVLPRARSSSGALVRLAHSFLSAFFFSVSPVTSDLPVTHQLTQLHCIRSSIQMSRGDFGSRLLAVDVGCRSCAVLIDNPWWSLWRSKWCLGCFWEVKTEHCMGIRNRLKV